MECLLFRPHPHKKVYAECWRGKKKHATAVAHTQKKKKFIESRG